MSDRDAADSTVHRDGVGDADPPEGRSERRGKPADVAGRPRGPASPKALIALIAVLLAISGQELLEMLLLESPGSADDSLLVSTLVHAGEVVAVVIVAVACLRSWRQMDDRAERLRRRSGELELLLAALEDRQRTLARTLERREAQHEEQRRLLAYDIHNGLAQIIVSAKQHLDTFEDLWQTGTPDAPAELGKGLDRLGRAVVEARLLLATLRPGRLESLGFIPALKALVEHMSQASHWDTQFTLDLRDLPLPGTVEAAVYRIVQEALANIARHAKATKVTVGLRREAQALVVEVADAGVGFEVNTDQATLKGLGIVSMRERARLVGGILHIESGVDRGTRIRVSIPLEHADA